MKVLKQFPNRCQNCNELITKRNKIVKIEGYTKTFCKICIEKKIHENIISYLKGESSPIFICSKENGLYVQIPSRDNLLSLISDEELIEELKRRLNK